MQSVQHLCLRTVNFINRDNSFHLDSVARVKKLDSVTKQWLKINIRDLCFLLLNIVLCFGDIHADIVFVLLCNYFHSSFAVEINSKGKVVPV